MWQWKDYQQGPQRQLTVEKQDDWIIILKVLVSSTCDAKEGLEDELLFAPGACSEQQNDSSEVLIYFEESALIEYLKQQIKYVKNELCVKVMLIAVVDLKGMLGQKNCLFLTRLMS